MSIRIVSNENGLITLKISGALTQSELVAMQRDLATRIDSAEKTSILIDAREFGGWAKGGDWGDLDAQYAVDPMIHKMAIVADPKWETLANAFTGKGLRRFPIETFAPADFDQALAWASEA